ncbi:MAG TPA: FkbM family methyltransferase [Micromonosporaceae bacterium]|nr:FkbM family methyltransferase [Micromonosporaceae bacterium]
MELDTQVELDTRRPAPATLACLIYTSGSTGRPKRVAIDHANLAALYHSWEHAYRLSELRTHAQLTSFSFVVCQADLVRALCSGATLLLCPAGTVLTPHLLYEQLAAARVDFAEFVPPLLRTLLDHCRETGRDLGFLRLVAVGSDRWLYGEHAELHRMTGPDTTVVHSFGLTETTVDSAYFTGTAVKLGAGQLTPIGRPFPNVRLYVLDNRLEPVPVGINGELYVGGAGVARGYLGDPGLTAQRFVPDPFGPPGSRLYRTGDLAQYLRDGNIRFLGRRDTMTKIRGFRVELGEVEMTLREHPGVRDAVVAAVPARRPAGSGPIGGAGSTATDLELAAFVVPTRPVLDEARLDRMVQLPDGSSVASVNNAEAFQFHQELLVDRLYLRHEVCVEDGDIVFDVGANIGMFALSVHREAKVSVYAFEPSPEVFEALSLNVTMHGIDARLFRYGLSDRPRRASFTYYPASTGMSSVYGDPAQERAVLGTIIAHQFEGIDVAGELGGWLDERLRRETRECELRTLSGVLAEEKVSRIDLLKIVVQKSEWDVLQGLRDEDWARVGQLVVEVYDLDGRLDAMRRLLVGRGYKVAVEQAPLFTGSGVHLVYAVRPEWRRHRPQQARPSGEQRPEPVAVSARSLFDYLRRRLVDYMVPTRLAIVERLPLTSTGKVDRGALPVDQLVGVSTGAAYLAPRTEVESGLVDIWREVLRMERVGVRDDFFLLGGHSLLATQVVSRVQARWGVDLPLRVFLTARTVEELAREVTTLRDRPGETGSLPIRRLDRAAYRRTSQPDQG